MKKSLYLKLSQQETNKKLQLSLVERHNRIKMKNRLLGWLYFLFAYIVYSSVAIVSFAYRLAMLPKDFRFTPHYMQTVIEYNNMGIEQANEYLKSQLSGYKKSRSYGNFSLAERDAINVTFELLLEKYKLPEPEDNKHLAVISGLSKIENLSLKHNQNILNLNSDIKEVSAELSTQITNQNTIVEKQLINIEQCVIEGDSRTKESVSFLSDQIVNQEQKTSSQIQDQNNLFREELAKTNDKVSESANALSKQNDTIKNSIIIVSQSVDNTHDSITNITDKVSELSLQQANSFLETQELIDNVNSNVEQVKSTIEPIASYTEQKQQKEEAEEEHIKELKERQEKRKTTAHNREKGKKLNSFESALTDKQIAILVGYCNKIAVFDRDIEFQDMKQILLCTHQRPLKLTVNKYLALLFSELSDSKLICKTWKSVAANHKCFISSEGKHLTPNDLYMANQTAAFIDPDKYDLITECVDEIKKLHRKQ